MKDNSSESHIGESIVKSSGCVKMMNNAFYFILKALFVPRIFKFLSRLFGHVEKTAWLER